MTNTAEQRESIRGSLVFALLALGLVVAIYVLRVVPADRLLAKQRQARAHWETTHEKTRRELERLDALSITIGSDSQITERYMRKQNFARSGEFSIDPGETGN